MTECYVGDPFDGTAVADHHLSQAAWLFLYEDPVLHGNHDASLRHWDRRDVLVCGETPGKSTADISSRIRDLGKTEGGFVSLVRQIEAARLRIEAPKHLGFIQLPRFPNTDLPLVPTLLKIVSK